MYIDIALAPYAFKLILMLWGTCFNVDSDNKEDNYASGCGKRLGNPVAYLCMTTYINSWIHKWITT